MVVLLPQGRCNAAAWPVCGGLEVNLDTRSAESQANVVQPGCGGSSWPQAARRAWSRNGGPDQKLESPGPASKFWGARIQIPVQRIRPIFLGWVVQFSALVRFFVYYWDCQISSSGQKIGRPKKIGRSPPEIVQIFAVVRFFALVRFFVYYWDYQSFSSGQKIGRPKKIGRSLPEIVQFFLDVRFFSAHYWKSQILSSAGKIGRRQKFGRSPWINAWKQIWMQKPRNLDGGCWDPNFWACPRFRPRPLASLTLCGLAHGGGFTSLSSRGAQPVTQGARQKGTARTCQQDVASKRAA